MMAIFWLSPFSIELLVADLDFAVIEQVRSTWQFYRDRRPEAYNEIVEI